ncbi:hypothetical protein J2732_000301 [Achromobacter deleyi]|uniref:hypothetical protein n=1 Tax=Achromobacter deleyi TaxID=1353891 RepID=UPI00285DE812|nr:hypothetical protein [Achromobacter deleyi]MDR6599318.1 hypothetical protein [Achromobacter deleyi]
MDADLRIARFDPALAAIYGPRPDLVATVAAAWMPDTGASPNVASAMSIRRTRMGFIMSSG